MTMPAKDPLTFDRLRAANLERLASLCAPGQQETAEEWMTWMIGEVGELATLLKRIRCWSGKNKDGTDVAFKQLADELGDVQTYLDLLAWRLGVDLGEATRSKFNEVSERRGSKVRL
jgi:NTP pyrophosphatase (non-canonical NTP hydrolase)